MEETRRDAFSDEDIAVLTRRAEAGDPDAMSSLAAREDYHGYVAEYWYRRSLEIYEAQARAGDVFAMMHLAERYGEEHFGMQDDYTSAYWYACAAQAGDPEALARLGWIYCREDTPLYDEARSFYCLQKALEYWQPKALAGDMDAVYEVGWLYMSMDPRVHPEATGQALHWLSWAAESGNSKARSDIGSIYWDKRRSVCDVEASVRWYLSTTTLLERVMSEISFRAMYKEDPESLQRCDRFMQWLREMAEYGNPFAVQTIREIYGEDEEDDGDEEEDKSA